MSRVIAAARASGLMAVRHCTRGSAVGNGTLAPATGGECLASVAEAQVFDSVADRPKLTAAAFRRWLPSLVRRAPDLLSVYLVPGRLSPRLREVTMLGVTSVNRCAACDRVHRRWARSAGLALGDLRDLAPDEAAAYAYGQALAATGPRGVEPPQALSARHRRELEAAGLAMELANLVGNRLLPERGRFNGC